MRERGWKSRLARCLSTMCRPKLLRLLAAGLVMASALGTTTPLAAEIPDGALRAAEESITTTELKQHVSALGADTYEGREAGSRGGHAAGGYIVKELSALKLKPAGDNGYFQSWDNEYRNILALWEGSDPQLKHELIVVGAHYDHVGYGTSSNSFGPLGYIHNGADDNASGTSAVLEVAEAFASMDARPKRSILFAWWDAEEKGLLGSKHWLANRTLAEYTVVMDFNMDMVGRMKNSRLEVSGIRTAPGLREFVARHMEGIDAKLAYDWNIREDSDHWPFYNAGIPFVMLHTGLHEDYHRPSDDADKLNIDGIRETSRLMIRLVADAADRSAMFKFRAAARRESEASHDREKVAAEAPPSRLGIRWDANDETHGLVLTEVVTGSAADQAQLVLGDRLLTFNGANIPDGDSFRTWILGAPQQIQLTYHRNGMSQVANVTLTGYPVRLGISWKEDDAEPGCVRLSRVVDSSPAQRAGLALADRVMSVNGQSFANGEEFRNLLEQAGAELKLEVERDGAIQEIALKIPEVPALSDR